MIFIINVIFYYYIIIFIEILLFKGVLLVMWFQYRFIFLSRIFLLPLLKFELKKFIQCY